MRDPLCPFCLAAPVEPAAAAPPDHIHCDRVVLLPEHRSRRGEIDRYRGAWSRGVNLWIVVSREPGPRRAWRAVLRQHMAPVNLVVAEGDNLESTVQDLEDAIDDLRGAFGRRRNHP